MPIEKTLRKHARARSVITRKKYRTRVHRKLNLPPRKVTETNDSGTHPVHQKYFLAYILANWKATRAQGA
ncbi:MAG: hypothetical protein INR73_16160 [Williamsia sp.]|nr:hypothetical protein [Williamsia sp.]